MQTRTGNYPIGFRRGGGQWQKDIDGLITWAKSNDLGVIDVKNDGDKTAAIVRSAGLQIGSIDLLDSKALLSPDKGKRAEAVAQNAEYIGACVSDSNDGPTNFFIAMIPEDASLPRAENFGYMVESFNELTPAFEANNARLVIEGWPGTGALCCTPEGYRAFFEQCPSSAMGVNYDPSHLIRMGIDPLRFLREFVSRVYHVHGKDTMILTDNQYEYGTEQPPTFAKKFAYGSMHWRYTIPGHGLTNWFEVFSILQANDYAGCVSIELEDANFNGQTETEQEGIVQGARFLTSC